MAKAGAEQGRRRAGAPRRKEGKRRLPTTISNEGMTALVEQYGDEMLRLAILYLGSREQAEDAVQDSFIKIFRAGREDSVGKSFVMRVLVNTCKDYLKSGWNKRVELAEDLPEAVSTIGCPQQNEAGALRQAILELPLKYREVILLRYYEGLAVNEIARILHAPQPTVSGRLRRACALLEKRLEGIAREDL